MFSNSTKLSSIVTNRWAKFFFKAILVIILIGLALWLIARFIPKEPSREDLINTLASQSTPLITPAQKTIMLERLNDAKQSSELTPSEKAAILEKLSSQ